MLSLSAIRSLDIYRHRPCNVNHTARSIRWTENAHRFVTKPEMKTRIDCLILVGSETMWPLVRIGDDDLGT